MFLLKTISVKSAPDIPSVNLSPTKSKDTSFAIGVFLNEAYKIEILDGLSGNGM